jgi:hypothetical protein
MIMPNRDTPVPRCLELALYTEHMLGKFPENPRLVVLSARMREGGGALEAAHLAHENEYRVLERMRIDVDFENYLSDARVRRTRKMVELEDGHAGGRIASQVFSAGSLDMSRIQGARQIEAMRTLELRLLNVQDIWPGAAAELAEIVVRRSRYSAALDAREACKRRIVELRLARDAVKERFLQLYAEIASLVQAEFPRDRKTQELFFRDAYERRPAATPDDLGEDDEPAGDVPGDEPAGG